MWVYEQKTGRLISPMGGLMTTGYSGFGEGKNNPAEEYMRGEGPIPEGWYDIQAPYDSPDHGPFVMRLLPDAENVMHDRDGFLIHGDSSIHPGEASRGCIILPRFARLAIYNSRDFRLHVVKELPTIT